MHQLMTVCKNNIHSATGHTGGFNRCGDRVTTSGCLKLSEYTYEYKNSRIQRTHETKSVISYLIVTTHYFIYCSNEVIILTQIWMHSMFYTQMRRMGKIPRLTGLHSLLSLYLPLFHPLAHAFCLPHPISISRIQKPRNTYTPIIYRTHKHAYKQWQNN